MHMKKISTLLIAILLPFSALLLSGCSQNGLKPIDMSTYYKSTIETTIYKNNISTSKSLTLDKVTADSPNMILMDKYLDIKVTANSSWIYKMYIEKIEFYVLTNESTESQMAVSLNVTNLAKESVTTNVTTFSELKSHIPSANTAQKYTFEINQVVSKATGSTITIDISESSEILVNKNNKDSDFKWIIYGLKIYGEHREYSK